MSEELHKQEHTHGMIDPTIVTTSRGIWAVKWSFIGLMATAIFQSLIVYLSGSVALLADTIHNFGDALTAIPLWIAFLFARKLPTKQFTYGYGKVEDLAGLFVVLMIFVSAVVAGYESIYRFFHPQKIEYLGAIVAAAIIGFIGNEAVAMFRINVGTEIGSAALIADGYHARMDGILSLGVLLSVLGVWFGYPLADPIIGLLITLLIFKIVWESSVTVFTRMIDGVEADLVDKIRNEISSLEGIRNINEIRVRWVGHRLYAELKLSLSNGLSVEESHHIAEEVRHRLHHCLPFISHVVIESVPENTSVERGYVHQ